jgi:hypothetical protein
LKAEEDKLMDVLKKEVNSSILAIKAYDSKYFHQTTRGLVEQNSFKSEEHEGKVFVRLSMRSPKDAVDKIPSKHSILVKSIRKEIATTALEEFVLSSSMVLNYHYGLFIFITRRCSIAHLDASRQMQALRRAFFEASAVTSAEEALELVMYR